MQGRKYALQGLLALGLVSIASGMLPCAARADSQLDPTFGNGGKVETGFGHNVRPGAGVIDPDGNLVVVGTIDNFSIATQVFHIARYLPNGNLDTTFGSGGSAIVAFTNFISNADAVAIQPDRSIVVVGDTESADGTLSEFAIARLTPGGNLDPSFGTGGKVTTEFFGPPPHPGGFRESADVVIIQPDGMILVGGVASSNPHVPANTALARYDSHGHLDPSFGTGGLVDVRAIGEPNALALLANGHILALSGSDRPVEFDANGTLLAGVTPGPIAGIAHTGTSMFQPDGYIPFAGSEVDASRNDLDVRVRRFNPTGGSDPGFTSSLFDFGPEDSFSNSPQAVDYAPSGQLMVGGIADSTASIMLFGIASVNPDGTFDAGFGTGGKVRTRFNGAEQVLALVVQSDNRTIAIGQTMNPNTGLEDMALARYRSSRSTNGALSGGSNPANFVEVNGNPMSSGPIAIHFGLAAADHVRAAIYDVGGREIALLADGRFGAGEHVIPWNGSDAQGRHTPAGVYFTRFTYGNGYTTAKPVVVVK